MQNSDRIEQPAGLWFKPNENTANPCDRWSDHLTLHNFIAKHRLTLLSTAVVQDKQKSLKRKAI